MRSRRGCFGEGLRAASFVVVRKARDLVPRDTGRLKRSLRSRRISPRIATLKGFRKIRGAGAQAYVGGRKAPHAVLVEYGTGDRSDAQPFMGPAAESTQQQQFAEAVTGLKKAYREFKAAWESGSLTATQQRLLSL